MNKRGWVWLFVSIFLVKFISAASYRSFSFRNFLDLLDPLMLLFVIFFAIIYFALGRVWRDNPRIVLILSLGISLFCVLGIYRTGFNVHIDNFLYDAIGEDVLYIVLPLFVAAIILLLAFKFGVGLILMGLGIFLLVLGILDVVYERLPSMVVGVILIILGFWFWRRKKKRESVDPHHAPYSPWRPPGAFKKGMKGLGKFGAAAYKRRRDWKDYKRREDQERENIKWRQEQEAEGARKAAEQQKKEAEEKARQEAEGERRRRQAEENARRAEEERRKQEEHQRQEAERQKQHEEDKRRKEEEDRRQEEERNKEKQLVEWIQKNWGQDRRTLRKLAQRGGDISPHIYGLKQKYNPSQFSYTSAKKLAKRVLGMLDAFLNDYNKRYRREREQEAGKRKEFAENKRESEKARQRQDLQRRMDEIKTEMKKLRLTIIEMEKAVGNATPQSIKLRERLSLLNAELTRLRREMKNL